MDFTSGKSTTAATRVMARALEAGGDAAAAAAVVKERDWRNRYPKYVVRVNELCLAEGEAGALAVARAGLAALREEFSFEKRLLGVAEAGGLPSSSDLDAVTITGGGPATPFAVPFNGKDYPLDKLDRLVKGLAARGVCEQSVVASVERLQAHPEWLGKPVLGGYAFAILGAGSQMGPCRTLLKLGATVIAVDLHKRPAMWAGLIAFARDTPGQLIVPVAKGSPVNAHTPDDEAIAAAAGCDLLRSWPAAARFIIDAAAGRRVVLASFVYADGALFAKLAVAADALTAAVCEHCPRAALVSLCSPTEVFSVPEWAVFEAARRYNALSIHTPWERFVEVASGARYLEQSRPLKVGADHYLQDSLVVQQGPNYAFAKLLQRWRNIVSRGDRGCVVSSNVAPASLTESVMHAPLIRAGMLGCQHFGILPFEPATANTLMTALALHDILHPGSAAHPTTPLANPLDLFIENSVHGGTWRCPFKTNSYTEVSAVLYGLQRAAPWAAAGVVGAVAYSQRSKL